MNETPNLVLFFGRFHPLLVHLPIGGLILLVVLEALDRLPRFRGSNASAGYLLAVVAPAAAGSAMCGWLLSHSGGYEPGLLRLHFLLGVGTAGLCCLMLALRWLGLTKQYAACLYATVLIMATASHYGGALTHGSDYLFRYAPGLLGSFGRAAGSHDGGANPSKEGVYATLIAPMLERRCVECHSAEKHKAGLRLDTFDTVMKGGDGGPVVVAGKAAQSPLVARVRLPLHHDDHMPPEGKPQLTPDEIQVLAWWIDAGAPRDAAAAGLQPPPEVQRAITGLQAPPR